MRRRHDLKFKIQRLAIQKISKLLGYYVQKYGYKSEKRINEIRMILKEVHSVSNYIYFEYKTSRQWFTYYIEYE